MADGIIVLPPDSTGKILNTSQKVVGVNTVQSERHVITDNVNNNYANVSAAGGLQVDGSAVVQPVSGAVTTTPPANASTNITQIGGSALTEGQKVMASSVPVVVASDQSAVPVSGTVSVSNFPATQPVSGSVSVSNFPATQAISAASLPLPTGASTAAKQPALGTAGTPSTDVITVQGVASMTPIKTDGSAVVQPVSGTVAVSNFPATQPVSGTVTANAGTGNFTVVQATGTNLHAVLDTGSTTAVTQATAANLNATVVGTVAATQSGTWTVQPGNTPNTTAWVVTSNKSNNSAAPGTTNLGTLPAVANAAPPAFTEANQAAISIDLAGNLRVYGHPPNVLGAYMVNGRTGIYTAQPAGAPLFSFRWTSATALAVIMRVAVTVATTTATTVVGNAERELIIARSFTVSDTGGTAVVLTGNNQKMRTSQATSAVGDMRFASNAQLTAGTRTLDANPLSSTVAVLPLLFTGIDIGSGGVVTTTATVPSQGLGGRDMVPLLNATTGQDYPIVLAQNEGFIIRIGKDAQPTTVAQQTYAQITWCEVSAY